MGIEDNGLTLEGLSFSRVLSPRSCDRSEEAMRTLDQGEARSGGRRPATAGWWLIARDADGGLEPLTVDGDGGGQTLPVFGFEEEAQMFLWGAGLGGPWRVRQSGCGELVSVLCGPCRAVGSVALDPLPAMATEGTLGLVSLGRDHFLDHLLDEGRR